MLADMKLLDYITTIMKELVKLIMVIVYWVVLTIYLNRIFKIKIPSYDG